MFEENNEKLNDESRATILAYREKHGEAWLGLVNRYANDRGKPWIRKWDGDTVYNFTADFVLPAYDAELERLLSERENTKYTGTRADRVLVDAIFDRIEVVGGKPLVWT